ncbi:3-hydroxyanthranilic acid dioxygenase, required for the de novo biosynthesis of NAD from tryptophan [Chytriomyces sp. MP71]|nr:3-hydroxyanthranilic acid dioxygenase, required for the de novo biosynthesis of NAD from tryptophan [Chytriomyces sp. MP71]
MLPPINFPKWIEENKHLLQPPVNNFCLYQSDFIVMALGGPNKRTDYHVNPTEEYFYQHKGDMLLKVVDNGAFKDVPIREGEMFLLPANIPHNPVRFENTIGIVIEMKRPLDSRDSLRWYCEREDCRKVVYEESFYCTNLGVQLKPVIEKFAASEELRTCKACGTVNMTK